MRLFQNSIDFSLLDIRQLLFLLKAVALRIGLDVVGLQ